MRYLVPVRPMGVGLLAMVIVAGMSFPARAEAPGAPGPDPARYAPPFSLSHPVTGRPGFADTFGAIRDDGERLHHGIDIGAPTGTPVLAVAPGVVSFIGSSATAGLFVEIRHAGGWRTRYLHLNDVAPPQPDVAPQELTARGEEPELADELGTGESAEEAPDLSSDNTPVTDKPRPDDESTETVTEKPDAIRVTNWGIPADISVGVKVTAGDPVGFVGYSGNASIGAPHLHFELRMPDGIPVNPYPFLTGRAEPTTLYVVPDITDEPISESMNVLGHVDPGDGFNSVVWAYAGVAYLGTYGSDGSCPALGVRRYVVVDPQAPIELEPISDGYPGTWTSALWVGTVTTSSFSGTLAIVGHRACGTDPAGAVDGLAFYDVTNPATPVALGVYDAGSGTQGVADFDVWVDGGRVLVGAVVPNSFLNHVDNLGDVRLIDITDPGAPADIADWDYRRDGADTTMLDGSDHRELRAEAIVIDPDGRRAFVAQWDAGIVVLDLTSPDRPQLAGRHEPLEHPEGNAAALAFDSVGQVLAVTYRDLDPLDDELDGWTWGMGAVLDVDGEGDPSVLSRYSLAAAEPDPEGRIPLDGIYAAFDGVIAAQRLYAAWASGGLRIMDLHDPVLPFEIASFVPPTRVDPQRHLASPNGNIAMPFVWSVHVTGDVIYVADLNTGLWILQVGELPEWVQRRLTTPRSFG